MIDQVAIAPCTDPIQEWFRILRQSLSTTLRARFCDWF